ncbi:hypothetical protein RUM43_012146 [Polyplax serrata]|uniref:D-glucuronyl C5-epimerase beta-sandwich domain-containing protein n=1 Tax=Polyplax serrata TaxID=468196 RepID=A0AAN8PUJ5_POLSC
MRVTFRTLILLTCVLVVFVILSLWTKCTKLPQNLQRFNPKLGVFQSNYVPSQVEKLGSGFEEIECVINQEYSVSCRKEGEEIYLPFAFLHKYFEASCLVYGKLANYDGLEKFEWSHTYSRVNSPKEKYNPRGVFMYFEKYNVESRDRVKCLSAIEGVPISTQWESKGYYYPTQIAQFGLSHYSKNLTEPEPKRKILEDGNNNLAAWEITDGDEIFKRVESDKSQNWIVEFKTSDSPTSQVFLKLDHVVDLVLQVDIKLLSNSSLTVTLESRDSKELFYLHYISSDVHISVVNEHTYHGVGMQSRWIKITRDLIIDVQKGIAVQGKQKRKIPKSKLKIVKISLHGSGCLDNLTLSSSEHLAHFYDAAEWFVNHQDPNTGGWVNPVRRKLAAGLAFLDPGWQLKLGQFARTVSQDALSNTQFKTFLDLTDTTEFTWIIRIRLHGN